MLTFPRVIGALVLLKAVDVALRGPGELPPVAWAAALGLWLAGGAALTIGRTGRTPWAAVLVAGLALAADVPLELRRQHLVLLVGVALVGAVTTDDGERLLLWRLQLSALYAFAAVAKLNETFLSGSVLAGALTGGPVPLPRLPLLVLVLLGVLLIAVEVLLAASPWVLQRVGLLVAVALHGTALLVIGGGPLVTLRLVVFGGTAVALHAVAAGTVPTEVADPPGAPPVRPSATGRP